MAKFVQPNFSFHGIGDFKNNVQFDSSLAINGGGDNFIISKALTTSAETTPYALVMTDTSGTVNIKQLGTMAWESSTNYLPLSGGTMTGLLTLSSSGISLDSQTITQIDTSADGVSGSDSAIPTSGAVQKLVNSSITDNISATNGITEDPDNTFKLGGTLSENTTIDVSGNNFKLNTSINNNNSIFEFDPTKNGNDQPTFKLIIDAHPTWGPLGISGEISDAEGFVKVGGDNVYLKINNNVNQISNNEFVVYNDSSRGIEYAYDYGNSFYSDETLPAWKYVKKYADDKVSGAARGASNGLQILTDGSYGLGGDLTTTTSIKTKGNRFEIDGSVFILGDLIVDGSVTEIESENLVVQDNIITINASEAGNGVSLGFAGIKIDRGTAIPYMFVFDENTDTFRIGIELESSLGGVTQAVATREDDPQSAGLAIWNDTKKRFDTDSNLTFDGSVLNVGKKLNLGDVDSDASEKTALLLTSDGSVVQRELSDTAFNTGKDIVPKGPITVTNGTGAVLKDVSIAIDQVSSTKDGYLSSSDFTTFSDKIDSVASVNGVTGGFDIYAGEQSNAVYIKKIKAGSGISITDDGSLLTVARDTTSTTGKYTGSFNANGITTVTVGATSHKLGTGPFNISVYENGTDLVYVDIQIDASSGDIKLTWAANALTGTCKYIITA